MIVKVQVSIFSNVDPGVQRMLIYSRTRKTQYEGPVTDDVLHKLQGRPKAFFFASLRQTSPGEHQLVLRKEAPWQDW